MPDIAPQHYDLLEIIEKPKYKTILLIGERSTGKTTDACHIMSIKLLANIQRYQKTKKVKKICIMRQNAGAIKATVWQSLVNSYLEFANTFEFRNYTELQETQITGTQPNQTWVFCKGFKTSTKTDTAKNKGLESVNCYLIDEAEEISKEDLVQLQNTAIRENAVIILICNTPGKNHWITKSYLDLIPTEYESYFDFKAKPLRNFSLIRSRLGDNIFLSEEVKENYRECGDPNSLSYDLDRYCHDVLGLVSTNVKGQIFKNYTVCNNQEFDEIDAPSKFALDFGFSNDPTALIETKTVNNWLYIKQWIYQTGLTNRLLIERFTQLGITQETLIIADSGGLGGMLISELQSLGWNIKKAIKGAGSIQAGILKLKEYSRILITQSSQDVLDEFNNYSYQLDSNKEPTTEPIDAYNHAIDCLRYLEVTQDRPVLELNDRYKALLKKN